MPRTPAPVPRREPEAGHSIFLDHLAPDGLDPLVLGPGSAILLTVPRGAPDGVVAPRPSLLWLVGEIDLVTVPGLTDDVRAALPDHLTGPVVLDLSRVTFMDLSGLRMLLRLQSELSVRGVRLVLRAPSPPVALLLRVVGPWAVLTVHEGTGLPPTAAAAAQ